MPIAAQEHRMSVHRRIPEGYLPVPSAGNPWFLLPADDPGPMCYFVLHLLSSREYKRRLVVVILRFAVLIGLYRFWPCVAPLLSWIVRKRT